MRKYLLVTMDLYFSTKNQQFLLLELRPLNYYQLLFARLLIILLARLCFLLYNPIFFWKISKFSSYNFKSILQEKQEANYDVGRRIFLRNASQLFQCRKQYKKFLHMLSKTFSIFIRGHHNTLVTCKATMCNRVWSDLFLAKGEKSDLS